MDCPPGVESAPCPPDTTEKVRKAMGYAASARLAGSSPLAFAAIAQALTQRGFSAPKIYEADLDNGFLLIEDLGTAVFSDVIPSRAHEGSLYAQSVDTLANIYRSSFDSRTQALGQTWHIHLYDALAMEAEISLFTDWYVGFHREAGANKALSQHWINIWSPLWSQLNSHAFGLTLRDVHAANLIWRPDRKHHSRIGLLDFQDALFQHPAYDLVSLIEDARRDVTPELTKPLKDRFFSAALLRNRDTFESAYAILAAQRNAKILGIFVRLSKRDKKTKYTNLIPRVARHFIKDITHPALKEVQAFIKQEVPEIYEDALR